MRDQLDPDHWCNGGEYGSSHPDALAMEALDAENKHLREELEQLRQALHDARIENSGQAAELERLWEARRWIPVEEQLPELNADVLVLSRMGACEVAWKDVYNGKWTSFTALGKITHWMPLPEPPEAYR